MSTKEILETVTVADGEIMKTYTSQEEVYEFLKTKGLTDSLEEFKATVEELKAQYSELNPDEIDAVAGGVWTDQDTKDAIGYGVQGLVLGGVSSIFMAAVW